MPQSATAPSRLGEELNKRRIQLRLEWGEVASRAKISPAHLRKFRAVGTGLSDLAEANLEAALGWTAGSIAQLRAGGPPTVAADHRQVHRVDHGKTLGDMLLERGLARPEDLTAADNIANDPVALEIVGMAELSRDARNEFLKAYAQMRRHIFEAVRKEAKRPQG